MVYWLYDNTAFLAGLKLTEYDLKKASTRNGAAWYVYTAYDDVSKNHMSLVYYGVET